MRHYKDQKITFFLTDKQMNPVAVQVAQNVQTTVIAKKKIKLCLKIIEIGKSFILPFK